MKFFFFSFFFLIFFFCVCAGLGVGTDTWIGQDWTGLVASPSLGPPTLQLKLKVLTGPNPTRVTGLEWVVLDSIVSVVSRISTQALPACLPSSSCKEKVKITTIRKHLHPLPILCHLYYDWCFSFFF